MKISQDLPQFNKDALIIVTGAQEAKIYKAFNGNLEILKEIRAIAPNFDDKGGMFKRDKGAGGRVVAAQEFDKEELTKDMLEQVSGFVKGMKVQEVYLVSPSHVIGKLKEVLPNNFNIKKQVIGNYCNNHEFDILKKL